MALYRNNTTGFLGEFASNPGTGYTAITAMPTDTVANRVSWWRGLDTYGQTSSWHPSVTRDAQDPGEATISIQFSQDIALISSEPDGTITNPRDPTNSWYVGATTEVRVYRGLTDVTVSEGWTLTKAEDGCTSTLSEAGGLYTLKLTSIPLLATNAGYIRITATRTGSGTFTKDFRFLKVFQGQDGANGSSTVILDLDNENQTVAAAKDGTWIAGTTATTTARLYLGATQLTSGITWSVQSATTGITYSETNNTSSYTVSVTSMTTALTNGTITVKAVYNGVTYTKTFTISKANAGADGTPATVYWLSTSASAIAKNAAGTYNPTSFTIDAYSQTGTNAQTAYTGRIRIQTQATLNGAWTTTYSSAGNESSTTYSVPASIVAIRVYLYQAGGFTTLLDQETLPVVSDGQTGSSGERGSRQIVITGTADWTDLAAWNGIIAQFYGTAPVLSDLVTIVNTSAGTSTSKFCTANTTSPGTWAIPSAYINGNLLVTGTVGANAIAANAITTAKIAAGSITADKLSIGTSGKNVLSNSGPTRGAETSDWAVGYYTCPVAPTVGAGWDNWLPPGGASVVINSTGSMSTSQQMEMNNRPNGESYPVEAGIRYEASVYISAHRCKCYVQINWYNDAFTLISISTGSEVTSTGSGSLSNWGRSELFAIAPPTASRAMFICKAVGTGESGPYLFATNAYFGRATSNQTTASDWSPAGGGTTLIDGAGIRTESITADRLVAGTITADSAAIASLSASKITTGTLNASTVSVTNLNAGNISGGTLSVDRIGTNSINGVKIGIGNNGIGTTNLVPGAVTWSAAASASGWITPTFFVWTSATTISVPANTNRGTIAITITLTAKNGWTSKCYVNLKIARTGWERTSTSETNGSLDVTTLSITDDAAPTGAYTYTIYAKYGKSTLEWDGTEVYRVIGGTILELKR